MKNITQEKNNFLLNAGYGERENWLAEADYVNLSEEEKAKYIKKDGGVVHPYFKEEEIPDYSKEEFETILRIETVQTQKAIEKHLATIKKCSIFFTILTGISLVIGLFAIINLFA